MLSFGESGEEDPNHLPASLNQFLESRETCSRTLTLDRFLDHMPLFPYLFPGLAFCLGAHAFRCDFSTPRSTATGDIFIFIPRTAVVAPAQAVLFNSRDDCLFHSENRSGECQRSTC